MPEVLIKIEELSFSYKTKKVLEKVSLEVSTNDFIAIIGPNGCGKTTLINLILGKLNPHSGRIVFLNGFGMSRIGYMPQHSNIDKNFPISIADVVLSGLQSRKGIFGRYDKTDYQRAQRLMANFFIDQIADKTIGAVSGGELQRAYICRALIAEPKVLILDEPDTYIDEKTEINLYETIKAANENMAILMVSHSLDTVRNNAKKILKLNNDTSWGLDLLA